MLRATAMAVSLIILDIWENIWSVCWCFSSIFCRSMLANWASSAVVDSCSSRSLMRVFVSSLIADTGLNGSPHIGTVRSHIVDSPASRKRNLWGYIDGRDGAQAVLKAIEIDTTGV